MRSKFSLAAASLAALIAGSCTLAPAAPIQGQDPAQAQNDQAKITPPAAPAKSQVARSRFTVPLVRGRDLGCPPKVWGQSRACARMCRKSRMRAAGVGGQRQ